MRMRGLAPAPFGHSALVILSSLNISSLVIQNLDDRAKILAGEEDYIFTVVTPNAARGSERPSQVTLCALPLRSLAMREKPDLGARKAVMWAVSGLMWRRH